MKKILFIALTCLIASKSFSQTKVGFLYSANLPLNPFGMAMYRSDDKFILIGNWNTGFEGSLYATKSPTGIYSLDYPGNVVIGENNAYQIDRNILSVSGGPVIYRNKEKDLRVFGLVGIGKYKVSLKEQTYYVVHDNLGVLDNYYLLKESTVTEFNPTIFTTGIFLEKGMFSIGAGINTPPAGSGAPIRTNFLIGFGIPIK